CRYCLAFLPYMLAFVIAKTRKQFASPLNLRYVAAPALVSIRTQWALTKEEIKSRWLKPELVAQIEFTEWTPDGHLRHSKFVGLRDDKVAPENYMRRMTGGKDARMQSQASYVDLACAEVDERFRPREILCPPITASHTLPTGLRRLIPYIRLTSVPMPWFASECKPLVL